ncbi:MAG: T9SS type A sorting domain-containing protein [Ignavibacteria bacterium]
MKLRLLLAILFIFQIASISKADTEPYTVDLEQIFIPNAPAIHSFAFAESNGRWLFIGGRTNGLHGFNAVNSFPKQFSNIYIYVVDPLTNLTYSRSIFTDLPFAFADQLRSANMQSFQDGNKLCFIGGYGYDSTANGLITFPSLKVFDIEETINAVMNGNSVAPYVRGLTDIRLQVCGGELKKLGDYYYLAGGHKFTGTYRINTNNQVYTDQIKKFKIIDDGINVSISDYTGFTDTTEYHRRDMNLIPAVKPDGVTQYLTLYGGVFKKNADLPFLNPIYIEENSITVDYSFEQKLTQYTTAHLNSFNSMTGSMHTTFFGGTSLYSVNDTTGDLVYDPLVPFINDISTLTKRSNGISDEIVNTEKMPALLGTNAKFILNTSVPHFDNEVIKLNQLNYTRTFVGYIYGGINAQLPNNGLSTPSDYIFKVYITPDFPLPVELNSFTSEVSGRDVKLHWNTSSEINNSGFYIERKSASVVNSNWENISFIEGNGNSNSVNQYSFTEKNMNAGRYAYRLKQMDYNGSFEYYNLSGEVVIASPNNYSLHQNYPNPFNPSTKIDFEIPESGTVSLKIYDILGNEMMTLINENKQAGFYSIEFKGSEFSSGVYYYKLESKGFTASRKMLLVK